MEKEMLEQVKKIIEKEIAKKDGRYVVEKDIQESQKELKENIDEFLKNSDSAMLITENGMRGYGTQANVLAMFSSALQNFSKDSDLPEELIIEMVTDAVKFGKGFKKMPDAKELLSDLLKKLMKGLDD